MNIGYIIAIMGGVATLLASWLKDVSWSPTTKSWLAIAVSGVMGFVAVWLGGVTDWSNAAVVVTAVIGAAQGYYTLITGPLKIDKAIATNVPSPLSLVIKPTA